MPEIKITISKVDEEGKKAPSNKEKVTGQASTSKTMQQATTTALIGAGKQLASYGISQYGNITGTKSLNNELDAITSVFSYGMQIVAGGIVGASAVAVQLGTSAINNYISNTKANQEAQLLLQRTGNASLNGGRIGGGNF